MKTTYRIKEYAPSYIRRRIRESYREKYFLLFCSKWKIKGVSDEASSFIKRCFWDFGSVAAYKPISTNIGIDVDEEICFADYAMEKISQYGYTKDIKLINTYNVDWMPTETMRVGKDVVIGYISDRAKIDSRCGIAKQVDYYVDRITAVEMTINTNLMLHKLPFTIDCPADEEDVAKDIIDQILNDEIRVFMPTSSKGMTNALNTNVSYIIDRLYQYKTSLENELLTYLSIDNSNIAKMERNLVDEVNANNAVINLYGKGFEQHFEEFTKGIKETFGAEIIFERSDPQVTSIHNDINGQGGNENEQFSKE